MSSRDTHFACTVDGCEYEWVSSASDVVQNGKGCLRCSGREPLTVKSIQKRLDDQNRQIGLKKYSGNSQRNSVFKCQKSHCGYEWETSANHILNAGTGCPRCSGLAPLDKNYIQQVLYDNCRPIEILHYAGKAKEISKFKCRVPDCGCVWTATSDSVLRGRGCPRCAKCERWTLDKIQNELDVNNSQITILSYCGNVDKPSSFRCDVDGCGYGVDREWLTGAYHILNGKKCPRCQGVERYTKKQIEAKLVELNVPIKLVKYSGKGDKGSEFICLIDGCGYGIDTPWVTGTYHILRGSQCPRCLGMEKHSQESIQKILDDREKNITVVSYGSGVSDPLTEFQCNDVGCGRKWTTAASSLITQGSGCPSCASNTTDNNMLYLFEDTCGYFKIGLGSWEDGFARLKVQYRKRKKIGVPLPKKVHRVVRVDDALKCEKYLLSKLTVNPYESWPQFDGMTECRLLSHEELSVVCSFFDSEALESMSNLDEVFVEPTRIHKQQ